MPRISDDEIRMYTIAALSYGLPVNANFFASYFGVSRKRAEELESYQNNFTPEEVSRIVKASGAKP